MRRGLAVDLNNIRQVKVALDGFATDFDGQYPNRATAARLGLAGLGFASSNDYFRQVFMTGETRSETIFWSKHSPVADEEDPDDVIETGGTLDPAEILQAGDCHWAYLPDQANTSDLRLPLIVDPFIPGSTRWDEERHEGKVVMLRIDGSAKALRIGPDGAVRNDENVDLMTPRETPGHPDPVNPRALLVQPEPASK